MVKQHDWVATLFFQPDKSLEDIVNLGITPDNASIKERDYYKEIPAIQEAFKTDEGRFDENKFNNFYQSALMLYNQVETDKLEKNILDTFEYDPVDIFAPIGSKERDVTARMVSYANPLRQSRGVSSLTQLGDPTKSLREIGQENKVFNYKTQQFENWTPNDLGLFSSITAPRLVLAAWDEDGEHEVDGRIIKHRKGDLKFNEEGDTYYETLGDRSMDGKELLHTSDILTVDGSTWNKYDFFDSDGLDKSVGGVIAKTAFTVAPMLIPGIGSWYGGVTAAMELGKFLPILWKSVAGILGGDTSNMSSVKAGEAMRSYLSRFEGSTSDYGKTKLFGIESIGNIITSSSTQLMQQKMIGKLPLMFTDKDNISQNAIKWGRALSLSYMAGTSSADTFSIFKEAGASDRMAGIGTLASMGAMGLLMNNDYFRDFWYEGTALSRKPIKDAIKAALPEVQDVFKKGTKDITKKEAANWFLKTQDAIYKKLSKISKNSLIAGFQNEALEETMEEAVVDVIKGVADGLNYLGVIDKDATYDFGFSFEEMAARYATAFVGGGIGGVVFDLHNKWDNHIDKNSKDLIEKTGFDEIIYLIRNGKADQLRKELARWHDKGKLGSKSLSGSKYEIVKEDDKSYFVYKEAEGKDSQNDIIYKQILDVIDKVETILDEERLKVSDLQLQMLRSIEPEKTKNLDDDELRIIYKTNLLNKLEKELYETKITSRIFSDWNKLSEDILSTRMKMENMLSLGETDVKTDEAITEHIKKIKSSENYKLLEEQLEKLREKRDEIRSGKKNDYYVGQILFAFNPELNKTFGTSLGKHAFTLLNYNKKYEDLTEAEREIIDAEYNTYTTTTEKELVYRNYETYWQLNNNLHKDIKSASIDAVSRNTLFEGYDLYEINTELNRLYAEKEKLQEEFTLETDENVLETINAKQKEINTKIEELRATKPVLWMRERSKTYDALLHTDENVDLNERLIYFSDYVSYLGSNKISKDPNDPILQITLSAYADELESLLTNDFVNDVTEINPDFELYFDELKKLISALRTNNINDIISILNTTDGIYEFIQEINPRAFSLMSGYFYTEDGSSGVDVKKMLQSYQELNDSAAYNVIDKFAKLFIPESIDVVQMFISEITKFGSVKNLEDYTLQNENAVNDLKKLQSAISILLGIIDANNENNQTGYVNIFRSEIGSELFETLTEEEQNALIQEIGLFKKRLDSLLQTIEFNNSQKMVEQKKISIHMKQKFANLLLNNEHSTIKSQFTKAFDVDLDELISESNFPIGEITDDNFKQYQTAIDKLETRIYEEVAKKGFSKAEIVDKIVKMFNITKLIRPTSTEFTKETEIITDYDQAVYLLSIITYPSRNFNIKYRELLKNPEFKKAPLFGQEYCVKLAYTFAHDIETLNIFLNRLHEEVKLNEHLEDENNTDYLHNRTALLNTIAVVLGAAGSGKTNGVSNIFAAMLDDSWNIAVSAPEESQTKKLESAINKKDIKSFTKNELIEAVLGRPMTEDDYEHSHNMFKLKSSVNVRKIDLFDGNKNNILFLDEISLYSAPEIELLTKWAVKNNVLLFFAGDLTQNKRFIEYEDSYYESGLEDFIFLRTPKLKVSLRPNNIAQSENSYQLQKVVDYVHKNRDENPELTKDDLQQLTEEYFKNNGQITLTYFETEGVFAGGTKIILDSDSKSTLESLLNSGKKVAVITDKVDKYSEFKGRVEAIIDAKSVQGAEFDYVLIDKNFNFSSADGTSQTQFGQMTDLYTLTQRATTGSIVVNTGVPTSFIQNILDNSKSGTINSKNWEKSIENFKTFVLNSLENIPENEIEFINKISSFESTASAKDNPKLETEESISKDFSESPFIEAPIVPTTTGSINTPTVPKALKPSVSVPALPESKRTISADNTIYVDNQDTTDFWNDSTRIEEFNKNHEGKSVFDIFETKISDNQKKQKLQYMLASYFMFGYHKADKNKQRNALRAILGVNNRTLSALVDALENRENKKFKFKFVSYKEGSSMYCVELNGAIIPIVITNKLIRNGSEEDTSLEIKLTGEPGKNTTKGKTFTSIDNLSPITKAFQPIVLIMGDEEHVDVRKHQNNEMFYKLNEGKTFSVISVDPFATENDLKEFLTLPEEKNWTTKPNGKFRLMGVKRRTTTLVDLWDLCKKQVTKRRQKGQKSILTTHTLTKILKNIYKINKDLVIDQLYKVLVGYASNKNISVRFDFKTGDKTTSKSLSINKMENIDRIKTRLETNWNDDLFNISILVPNKNGDVYAQWGSEIFYRMFANLSGSKINDQNVSNLSILDRLDKENALMEDMPGGYYLNDNVPWDAAIVPNSVYHKIKTDALDANNIGFESDATATLPWMLLVNSNVEEIAKPIKEESKEPNLNPIEDAINEENSINDNIKNYFKEKGLTVKEIFTPVTSETWNYQHILVTLEDGSRQLITYTKNHHILEDKDGIRLSAFDALQVKIKSVNAIPDLKNAYIRLLNVLCGDSILNETDMVELYTMLMDEDPGYDDDFMDDVRNTLNLNKECI